MPEALDAVTDLCGRLDLLRLRYNVAFGVVGLPAIAAKPFPPLAEAIVKGLANYDWVAVNLCRAIVDPFEWHPLSDDTGAFYLSPIGRLLFAAGGYPAAACPQSLMPIVLGCSRQYAHTLVRDGKVRAKPNGDNGRTRMVLMEDVMDVLRQKIDHHGNMVDKSVKRV